MPIETTTLFECDVCGNKTTGKTQPAGSSSVPLGDWQTAYICPKCTEHVVLRRTADYSGDSGGTH